MRIGGLKFILFGGALLGLSAVPAVSIEPGLDVDNFELRKPLSAQAPVRQSANAINPNSAAEVVTLVAVGDTGLNAHMARVRPDGGFKYGERISWARSTRYIEDEIDGDINFMNLETIVTSSNALRREVKSFNFRMHPSGARHLVKVGFNLFSTANNHSMDFAAAGARSTLKNLEGLAKDGLLAWPGLGYNRERAARPWPMKIKGNRIAVSALGITTRGFPLHRAGEKRLGQMSYQSKADFALVTQRLSKAAAAYKILSVHYGIERNVRVDRSESVKLSGIALRDADIDLVLGHHAHVARGVELTGDKVILYGLGNFLHFGTADMGPKGMCRDYGLLAKLHLLKMPDGKLAMRAIEVLPLTNMHRQTRRMKPSKARKRVYVLNYLARALDNSATGAKGVRFAAQKDGSGLYCVAGSGDDPGRIGKLCKDWRGAENTPKSLARQIANSCNSRARSYVATGKKRRSKTKPRRRKSKPAKSLFSQIFGD